MNIEGSDHSASTPGPGGGSAAEPDPAPTAAVVSPASTSSDINDGERRSLLETCGVEGDAGAHPAPAPRSAPSADSGPPFQSVGFTISSLGYAVSRGFHETLAPLELEPREFALLRAVGFAQGQSQQAIGERLHIPPSRMVAFVDALEGRNLIERRHNPEDRRTRALHLTEAGSELLGRAVARAVEYEQGLLAGFRDGEREQLLDLLQRVAAQLGVPAGSHAAHAALTEDHAAD